MMRMFHRGTAALAGAALIAATAACAANAAPSAPVARLATAAGQPAAATTRSPVGAPQTASGKIAFGGRTYTITGGSVQNQNNDRLVGTFTTNGGDVTIDTSFTYSVWHPQTIYIANNGGTVTASGQIYHLSYTPVAINSIYHAAHIWGTVNASPGAVTIDVAW